MSATSPTVAYLDSSALVKLVLPEAESVALRTELARWERHVSSGIARVEVVRACALADAAARAPAEELVASLDLIAVDDELLAAAARIRRADVRSLDAIHLASALLLGEALGVAVTYDMRMLRALHAAGIPAVAPR